MDFPALTDRIVARGAVAGLDVSEAVVGRLGRYLELLGRWNRRMNLTALPVTPPSDEAIDRLLIEPLVAAGVVSHLDHGMLDIGSGAGSPALPLAVACPWLSLVMVESRARKGAFLREACRVLVRPDARVETRRFGDQIEAANTFDVITLRAVRQDESLLGQASRCLTGRGRLLIFGVPVDRPISSDHLEVERLVRLPRGSSLGVFRRSDV